ncbi:FeoA domain-containing protein [Vibrio sp. S4M6]|uniref:FeoA domain-containing protein n=1 Tax=Vibrio sinus TaxID=2946865 RepID=UPI00202A032B|nr:FeoA domain-containing protein [Vibrio sinus]MCL9781851.1 FeoA domain-containing protein [Vibrio sinus]
MSSLQPGQCYVVDKYSKEMSLDFRQRLMAMGMIPGSTFQVVRSAPLGDPIEIEVKGFLLSLRKKELSLLNISPRNN